MKIKLVNLLRDGEKGRQIQAKLKNQGTEAVLYIYDVIDSYWGVSAQQVADLLATLDGTQKLVVRFNSPGGDVFEGRAIASLISGYKGEKVGIVDGLAASAASTILYACKNVHMAAGSYLMIHNAWTWAAGDKNDLADTIKLLTKLDETIAADYAKRSGKSLEDVKAWMDAETWFEASEAVDAGMADLVIAPDDDEPDEDDKLENTFDLDVYNNVPNSLKNAMQNRVSEKELLEQAAINFENSQRRLRLLNLR